MRDSYQTVMEIPILNVDIKAMQFRNVNKFVLPCKISEGRFSSTSLDVRAFTWNQPENCLFKRIRSVYNGPMMKFNDQCFFEQILNRS